MAGGITYVVVFDKAYGLANNSVMIIYVALPSKLAFMYPKMMILSSYKIILTVVLV